MKTLPALAQGTPEWKAWRRDGIGGSDIAAICALSPFEDHTREQVFREKVEGVEREQNEAMYRGTVLEPHARLMYERRHRITAAPLCAEMNGYPWARVSLDGLCGNGARLPAERDEWILELKCPGWETHSAALAGHVPEYYRAQCQWQMHVCGIGKCDFVSFNPGERFTPDEWATLRAWQERPASMVKVNVFHFWHALPEATRLPAPEDWLAEVRLTADREYQAWLFDEAARFWFEVCEARSEGTTSLERAEAAIAAERSGE